jgi:hypothetical protein
MKNKPKDEIEGTFAKGEVAGVLEDAMREVIDDLANPQDWDTERLMAHAVEHLLHAWRDGDPGPDGSQLGEYPTSVLVDILKRRQAAGEQVQGALCRGCCCVVDTRFEDANQFWRVRPELDNQDRTGPIRASDWERCSEAQTQCRAPIMHYFIRALARGEEIPKAMGRVQ